MHLITQANRSPWKKVKMFNLKFNYPSMSNFPRLLYILLTGLTLTLMTGCGGGDSGNSDQTDKPTTLSGSYSIRHTVTKDTCSTGRVVFNDQLNITQSGDQISGRSAGGIKYSGVASASPYGFAVKSTFPVVRGESTQISIVYSDSERKFKAVAVFDFLENGKSCHIETTGEVIYYP